ncbi:phosphotransferase [Streptomyces sp. NPDC001787]|uniref:phosphotransferase family protein n=1 Tax=Streptomyces sp. NPDC001787 TaxID=3154523 RepID=UPI0033301B24
MTTIHSATEAAVRTACRQLGVPTTGLTLLRSHATNVYLLPDAHAVARVRPAAEATSVTRTFRLQQWLNSQGYPAVEPLAHPVHATPFIVTFWVYYPQQSTAPPASALGGLLRELHQLPQPPVDLPPYEPLASLSQAVGMSSVLGAGDRSWLTEAIDDTLYAYRNLDFPLGTGFIHGDAYPGNTLWDGTRVRLGDWDEASTGPRELDLANTIQGARFGRTAEQIGEFTNQYGYDPTDWPGLPVLVRMRDLHTLSSFIRRADQDDNAAADELNRRLSTLQTGDRAARWDRH